AGGGALLMATHAFGRELEVADRLVILAGGRILLDTPRGPLGADEIHRLYALHTEAASRASRDGAARPSAKTSCSSGARKGPSTPACSSRCCSSLYSSPRSSPTVHASSQ